MTLKKMECFTENLLSLSLGLRLFTEKEEYEEEYMYKETSAGDTFVPYENYYVKYYPVRVFCSLLLQLYDYAFVYACWILLTA